jgi:uncharacterized protein (DUF1499 family)
MGAAPFLRYAAMVASPAMFNWRRPTNLGVNDGRLAPCKRTPNCVSSQAEPDDGEHYIAPIAYRGTMRELQQAVESMPRSTVISADGQYLYAEFRTPLMRYVDDVELYYDERAGLVQVRSASRLGRRDFGVNRKRIEELRSRLRTITRAVP